MQAKKFDQIEYQNEYNREKYDRISLMVPKGRKDVIKETAKANGQSVNEFINLAIEEKLNK